MMLTMIVKYFRIVTVCGILLSEIWAKDFTSYWNIPTFACSQRFNLPLLNVTERYGIIQNFEDNFRGNQVSILYDPGWFPAIINASSRQYRNGGVPQRGNLKAHLQKFQADVDKHIPDKENSGLAIIDFELWRPVYRQNFGKLIPYKDLSMKLVEEANANFSKSDIENEASRIFTEYAKTFLMETIELGKQLRPNAKWGYYGLPHCFNGRENIIEDCEKHIQDENDATQWLYDSSNVIFPSIYMTQKIPPSNRPLMVKGRVREALRLSLNVDKITKPLVIPYHRYKFPDSLQYLNDSDNVNAFEAAKLTGADGIVLWGAWKDVDTIEKCVEFYDYVEDVLGPSVEKFGAFQSSDESTVDISELPSHSLGNRNFNGMSLIKLLIFVKLFIAISY